MIEVAENLKFNSLLAIGRPASEPSKDKKRRFCEGETEKASQLEVFLNLFLQKITSY